MMIRRKARDSAGGDLVTLSPCHRVTLSSRRGAAAVELAILLPFIALMFVGAVDFARVYYCSQTVESCARSGALYASGIAWRDPAVSAEQAAKDAAVAEGTSLDPPLQPTDVTVATDDTGVTVTVTYTFQGLTSYPGLSGAFVVQRSVRMVTAPKPAGNNGQGVP